MKNHLEEVAGLLDRYPEAGLAFGRIQFTRDKSELLPHLGIEFDEPRDAFKEIMRHAFIHPSTMIIRSKDFRAVGGFNEMYEFFRGRRVQAEDYDLNLRLSLESHHLWVPKK